MSEKGLSVVKVESSNRHVHLSAGDLARLFGPDYALEMHASLAGIPEDLASLTGFASHATVDVVNPVTGTRIKNVRVLGPCRELTQIELAFSDCRSLGINAPTRISGDTQFSAPCRLVNSRNGNQIDIVEGVIRAWRHVHMSQDQATRLNVSDRDLMAVKVTSPGSSLTFHDVLVRILPLPQPLIDELIRRHVTLSVVVHLDTDEANAAMLQDATELELFRQNTDGSLVSLIRNVESAIETNASRKKGRTAWMAAEAKPRKNGIRSPKPTPRLRAVQSKL
eukprot:m.192842 g.192842  ORF g.192842 m.192842 type:complete len:280 (-) comp24961_c0_seq7:2507-3346(-)